MCQRDPSLNQTACTPNPYQCLHCQQATSYPFVLPAEVYEEYPVSPGLVHASEPIPCRTAVYAKELRTSLDAQEQAPSNSTIMTVPEHCGNSLAAVATAVHSCSQFLLQLSIQTFSFENSTTKPASSAVTDEDGGLAGRSEAFFNCSLSEVQIPSIRSASRSISSSGIVIEQNPKEDSQPIAPPNWHHRSLKATPFQTGFQAYCLVLPQRLLNGIVRTTMHHNDSCTKPRIRAKACIQAESLPMYAHACTPACMFACLIMFALCVCMLYAIT